MTETVKSTKTRKIAIYVASAVLIVGVAGVVISNAGLDKALVKQKVDEYIAAAHERGLARGRDVTITYKDLEVVGGLTSKHVVILEPVMVVKPSEPQPLKPGQVAKTDSLTVTTPEILLYPTSMDLSSIRVSLAQPINFAATDAPEKSLLKLSSDKPLDVSFAQNSKNNVPYIKIDHDAPGRVDLTYLREEQTEGTEDATQKIVPIYDTLHVNFTAGSSIHANVATDGSSLGTSSIHYKPITMAPESAPEGVITIAAIDIDTSSEMSAKQAKNAKANINIGPITGPEDVLPQAPMGFALDAAFVGSEPVSKEVDKIHATPKKSGELTKSESNAETEAQPSTITINKLNLSVKEASISATAKFQSTVGDMLPSGNAEVAFVNVPFIRKQLEGIQIIRPENVGLVNAVVTQITGTPLAELKDVTIPVTREKGGTFKIGKASLEEILAVLIKEMMAQKGQVMQTPDTMMAPKSAAPALPAKDKPKAAPIAVPDNGVRG